MKILQVNKFLFRQGGAETYLFSLADLLSANGHEVLYYSQKNPANIPCSTEKYFISNLDLGKFSFSALARLPRIFWSFGAARQIGRLIDAEKPDLVHLHNIYHQLSPSIIRAIKRRGLPIVMTVHDFKLIAPNYTLRADGKNLPHKGSWLIDQLLKLEFSFHKALKIYRDIDLLIVPSEFVKTKLFEAGFDPDKIKVIPHFNTLETATTKPDTKIAQASDKYLLSFGRLDESKGTAGLIEAFAEIKVNGLKLKIAGAGPQESELKQLVKSLHLEQKVKFLGAQSREQLLPLIKGALLVVHSSRVHETFGLSVLEAMSLGKAVIASKTGAIPELIDDGQTGLLYSPADRGALKETIEKLLADDKLRQQLGANAFAKAQEYSCSKHLAAITAAYDDLAKTSSLPAAKASSKPLIAKIAAAVLLIIILAIAACYLQTQTRQQSNDSTLIGSGNIKKTSNYPRLVNLYWKTPITSSEASQLAAWDVVVLDMQAQENSSSSIRYLRQLNPDIIILAYTSANEIHTEKYYAGKAWRLSLWDEMASGAKSQWQLKDAAGNNISFWPGNIMMNLGAKDADGQTYGDYLADFYSAKVLSTGLWDGLLFDNTWSNAGKLGHDLDFNNDGKADSAEESDAAWRAGQLEFFKALRAKIGNNYYLIGNGDADLSAVANGQMIEGFPDAWAGGWPVQINQYKNSELKGLQPRLNIINSDTANTGNRWNLPKMRFSLASTLLFDGYYSFDYGAKSREQLWSYAEYQANLGQPLSAAYRCLDNKCVQAASHIWLGRNYDFWSWGENDDMASGVWRRDFEHGIVLVNSTADSQQISLTGKYSKADGQIVSDRFILPSQDGIILLKSAN